ncbi:hypothetical protein TOT_030000438 [Theileria orientalis strain Shintoku]|uniref:Uncharacterized protein n=1 Tax=Theileria orientalis strain Shintoku TaxID=869250 RepID=J4D940_THEOR|nr:hypothetical protein TOT_030000438 [Theileria orientalis strain Shintoku]PVC52770.1 hypothetical protein MACL_00000535 [Theileria orientalis]BAM41175.1 hypothetical protein TOT_030000438 [Theileria orientalis strain Shintoku]|eukprot:XP_009691476.1 hypothetical protein TOT_030000438 [Theileria orientalis strain Shintoku]
MLDAKFKLNQKILKVNRENTRIAKNRATKSLRQSLNVEG